MHNNRDWYPSSKVQADNGKHLLGGNVLECVLDLTDLGVIK